MKRFRAVAKAKALMDKIALKVAGKLPVALVGDPSKMQKKLLTFFGPMRGLGESAAALRLRNAKMFICIVLLLLIVSCVWLYEAVFGADDLASPELVRPAMGENDKSVNLVARAKYKDRSILEDVTIDLQPPTLGSAEIEEILSDIAKRIPGEILNENSSLSMINSDLKLMRSDEPTGADISWSSSDEAVITEEGELNMIEAGQGKDVSLSAHIRLFDASKDVVIVVSTGSPSADYDWTKNIEASVSGAVKDIEEGADVKRPVLPTKTKDGVSLWWSVPGKTSKGHLPEILILLVLGALLYRYRYKPIERKVESKRKEMAADFPDFIGKLTLLLGAGMVLTAAIKKITEDYVSRNRGIRKRELYEQLVRMDERMQAGNVSLVKEFSDIAVRSELRELMRFATVLADNIDKGSMLVDKLNMEGESLWTERKNRAQQAGSIAETKLTFPMCIQLLVVIMITIMPAAMEM